MVLFFLARSSAVCRVRCTGTDGIAGIFCFSCAEAPDAKSNMAPTPQRKADIFRDNKTIADNSSQSLKSSIYSSDWKINAGLNRPRGIWGIRSGNEKGKRAAGGIRMNQFEAAMVRFGDPAANRKAEAGTASGGFQIWPRFFDSKETFEDAGLKILWNARAVIGNADSIEGIEARARHIDFATAWRVLDRVIKQIHEHSAKQGFVRFNGEFRSCFALQSDLLSLGKCTEITDGVRR